MKRWTDRRALSLLERYELEEMLAEAYRDGIAAGRVSASPDVHTLHG